MKLKSIIMVTILKYLSLMIITDAEIILKTCSRDNPLNCPNNSICTQVYEDVDDPLKCICIENYKLNSNWLDYENLNNSMLLENYCITSNQSTYATKNKLLIYMRSPVRKEHLAFGILIVLMTAALLTVVLYGFKISNPLQKTKCIYRKLKRKRRHITPQQDMDELELNRRYKMQT